MKLTIRQIAEGEEEILIRCREITPQIEAIVRLAKGGGPKIMAVWEDRTVYIDPEQIFYLENVDGATYAYLADRVVRVPMSLKALELPFADRGFFRCAKAMILNIYRISFLKSEPGGRIRATMENGEQVIISRKYARELKTVLQGGARDE